MSTPAHAQAGPPAEQDESPVRKLFSVVQVSAYLPEIYIIPQLTQVTQPIASVFDMGILSAWCVTNYLLSNSKTHWKTSSYETHSTGKTCNCPFRSDTC